MLGFIRKWLQRKEGTTAVEFSLVGAPFIFMILGIIEMSLMFAMQSSLEAATTSAARIIRTGQLQQSASADPRQDFENLICETLDSIIPCELLQFQVVSVGSFDEADNLPEAQFDADGNLMDQSFDPGGSSDVVLVRIVHQYEIFTPLFTLMLSNHVSNFRIMQSAIVFQTEPYEFEDEEGV